MKCPGWQVGAGRGFGAPRMYVQGPGELDRLGEHVSRYGTEAFLLLDGFVLDSMGDRVRHSLSKAGVRATIERFGGECSACEIERVSTLAKAERTQNVVGVGGGKTLDTAKCVAVETQAAMIVVPTIASTDAPCSAIAVRYTPEGVLDRGLFLHRNPDLVLVDSAVVVQAPVRFLASGMGDALSTWYEARSNTDAARDNFVGERYSPTAAGLAVARQCHKVLLRDGVAAKVAAEAGALTPAVEAIIEANTLLSGIGFENCGVAAAHGVADALGVLDPDHAFMHGEKVGFGVLCLLVLEGREMGEFEEAFGFLKSIGLPTRLRDFGLDSSSASDIDRLVGEALADGASTWRVAAPVDHAKMRASILAADAYASRLVRGPARRWDYA
ncbi:MAG: glycerol dehydrogenase [Rhodobacteraceae bacterium]|nr:glycerol dehydrogenase [Paracoccaceae bacterium]